MKSKSRLLGLVTLALLAAACGGTDDAPPAFVSEATLESRMAADLGVGVYVEVADRRIFVMARERGRVLSNARDRSHDVRAWVARYASDLGFVESDLRVVGQGTDGTGAIHVRLTTLPEPIDTNGVGLDVSMTAEGELLAIDGNVPPAPPPAASWIGEDAARAAARAHLGSARGILDSEVPVEDVGVSMTADYGAKSLLAYRVTSDGATVWIDAQSGTVLGETGSESRFQADALAAEHYLSPAYTKPEERRRIDVEGGRLLRTGSPFQSRIEVVAFGGFARTNGSPVAGEPFVSSNPSVWDVGTPTPAGTSRADGVAVDAMHNVALGDAFFRRYLLRGPTLDGKLTVVVHRNDEERIGDDTYRTNASYNSKTKSVYFGDGVYVTSPGKANDDDTLPLALSLDVVGHELAHAFVDLPTSGVGEAGALDEGLSDVVGQLLEHEYATPSSRPDRHGEGYAVGGGVRNLAHPERGISATQAAPQANHMDTRGCLAKNGTTPLRDWRGRTYLLSQSNVRALDYGCIHSNATVVGHAFSLMTFGGSNRHSKVRVGTGVGWDVARKLWLGLLGPGIDSTTPVWRLVHARRLEDAAKLQVSSANLLFPSAKVAVACAWQAVGALDAKQVADMVGARCELDEAPSCTGKAPGWYCDEQSPWSGYECNGSIRSGFQCPAMPPSDPNVPAPVVQKLCVTEGIGTGASTRSRARLDLSGKPTCQSPWLQ